MFISILFQFIFETLRVGCTKLSSDTSYLVLANSRSSIPEPEPAFDLGPNKVRATGPLNANFLLKL